MVGSRLRCPSLASLFYTFGKRGEQLQEGMLEAHSKSCDCGLEGFPPNRKSHVLEIPFTVGASACPTAQASARFEGFIEGHPWVDLLQLILK